MSNEISRMQPVLKITGEMRVGNEGGQSYSSLLTSIRTRSARSILSVFVLPNEATAQIINQYSIVNPLHLRLELFVSFLF